MKPYALDQTEADWKQWATQHGHAPFVARQIREWIFAKGELQPEGFTNISKAIRESLQEQFDWSLPTVDTVLSSADGSEKILFRVRDGLFAECVLMPSDKRITLCISSQVGCRWGCTFCQTGRMGLTRSLSSGEILSQVILANHRLEEKKVSNVVFMGMGEPLDNFEAVVEVCRTLTDAKLFALSKHRVTVSTVGLVPEIERLGKEVAVSLAISLHSADNAHRASMMPVARQYPLDVLKQTLLNYPIQTRHGITFEYVMIQGENDSIQHAKQLVKFVHGLKAKVNLIPMNAHPGNPMQASEEIRLREFQKYLSDRSIPAPVRYSRGQDVSAACGQLAMKRQEELHLEPHKVARSRKREIRDNRESVSADVNVSSDRTECDSEEHSVS
ncbi:MAG: 23S rRNA (adenine(2503)-C(2))-methyltransferase RlmN [Puniceicoccaceae bacterium]